MRVVNEGHCRQARQRQAVALICLLSWYVVVYLLPLSARDLFVPDETRYAAIAREMIVSGDWTVPHFNGVRYFEKPVLGYWVHAASLLLFGENNFAVRFPSALAAGLSAILVFLLVKKARWEQEDEDRQNAPIAASLIFLTCAATFGVGVTALLDSLFSFLLTACIAAFYAATEARPKSGKEKFWLLAAGLLCGLAFLTKGFLAFVVPILTLVPYLLWQRRLLDILRLSWLPIVTAVAVALPWAVRIHLREPDFWNYFFWDEHIRRFAASDAQHSQSLWFFLLAAPAMVVPWTFLIPAAVLGIRKRWRARPEFAGLLKLCLCWLVVPFLFFSLSKGKLLTYILPCFPPFALLMALGLLPAGRPGGRSRLLQGGILATGLLFGLLLVALAAVQVFDCCGLRPYSQPWQAVMVAGGLLACLLFCWQSYRSTGALAKIALVGLALICIYPLANYAVFDKTIEAKCPGALLREHKPGIRHDDLVIADEDAVGAVCWYLQRDNLYVLGDPNELAYGFGYRDASARLLAMDAAAELIRQHPGKIVLVARAKSYDRWRDRLPPAAVHRQNGPNGYVVLRW